MMTQGLIEEMKPIALELDYANDAQVAEKERTNESAHESERHTKKDQIIALYESGVTDVAQIVRRVKARPSYVAQVLQNEGLITGYFDLYTTTAREQNVYTRFFRNVLSFRNVEAARESVARIDRLYNYFERLGDRAGQHQAMVLALTGKNRARWSGKMEEAQVFNEWLATH
ncbi:MAG TPA: hypothetical protein VK619_16715 [Pyrinomonadaceae bacterium]|nr:hypothetical protein [Pyrinomonadaceae bacterium]